MTLVLVVRMPSASAMGPERPDTLTGDPDALALLESIKIVGEPVSLPDAQALADQDNYHAR